MKFTQEEFDALPVVGGYRQCPTGDYSDVKEFSADCVFGSGCKFGSYCVFGSYSEFGSYCKFDSGCRFDAYCEFGEGCVFDSGCRFGSYCKFAPGCSVEDGSKIKDPENAILQLSYAGSAQRLTTAFNVDSGPIVRCGCFLGTLDAFRAQVRERHGESKHARVYLGWADLVEIQFGENV